MLVRKLKVNWNKSSLNLILEFQFMHLLDPIRLNLHIKLQIFIISQIHQALDLQRHLSSFFH